jgi:PAS domain S-box-containing protein
MAESMGAFSAQETKHVPLRRGADPKDAADASSGHGLIDVLCVDDDTGFLGLEKTLLERRPGQTVDTATSVREAMEKLRLKRYDAVVSDYRMPVEDGLEFLKELRMSGDDIPFILFTGKGENRTAIQALWEGATFYVEKGAETMPLFAELQNMITVSVERRRAQEKDRLSEGILRSLGAIDSNVIVVVDATGMVVDCSDRSEAVLGYGRDELVGRRMGEIIASGPTRGWTAFIEATARNEMITPKEFSLVRRDGTTAHVRMSSSSLRSDDRGSLSGAVCVIRDMSTEKQMEQRLNKAEKRYQEVEGILDDICDASDPEKKYSNIKKAS